MAVDLYGNAGTYTLPAGLKELDQYFWANLMQIILQTRETLKQNSDQKELAKEMMKFD